MTPFSYSLTSNNYYTIMLVLFNQYGKPIPLLCAQQQAEDQKYDSQNISGKNYYITLIFVLQENRLITRVF